jgi:hypothetical protein
MSAPKATRRERLLRIASVLAIVGLVLVCWSILDPRPVPVLVALSVGQAIGGTSFLLYLIVVATDLRVRRALRDGDAPSDPP